MASRLAPDFPAVLVALEHIKELEKELKVQGVSFSPDASVHLAAISAAITGLETEGRAAHEHLEVATIENSKLRHQINICRDQMSEVIVVDVAAARASNAEEIEQLRKDLLALSQHQEATVSQHEALVSQNKSLFGERVEVKEKHQEVIAALNNEITQKYALQLQLDQTRETIEELNTSIASFEKETLKSREILALEKEAFAKCRSNLLDELAQNNERIKQLEHEILLRRKELELLNDSKKDGSDSLDDLRIQTIQLESSVEKLQASKSQSEQNLEAEKEKHKVLKAQKEALEKELYELIEAFNKTITRLKKDTVAVEQRMVGASASRLHIQDALAKVYDVFKVHDDEEREVRAQYEYVSAQLEKSRVQLEECRAIIVRHKQEVSEMDRHIEGLKEADVMNRRVFERDQGELCSNMDTERDHLEAFEDEERQLQKLLEETKRKQEEHVKQMTADIKAMWKRYKELQVEEAALTKQRPLSADAIQSYIVESKAEYKQIEVVCEEEIKQCTTESEAIIKACEEKQKDVVEKEKILQVVEAKWKEEVSRHERVKRQDEELKMKSCDLEQSIESLKMDTVSLLQPKEDKNAQLESIRAAHMDQLKRQASQLNSVEMRIYDSGVKLEQVQVENSRLQLCIRHMREGMTRAREDKDRYREETERLKQDTKILLRSIREAFREEFELTQERHSIDAALMIPMDALQSHLKTRRRQLGHVQTLLHEQMLECSRRFGDKITVDPQS